MVASAAAILVANKVPGGGEAIEKTLTGSILWVTWPTIAKLAVAYAALGVSHYMLRNKFLTISFHPEEAERAGWKIRWWDFWFYLSFGVVITLAVPVAGVLMVFSFLVVPAVVAFLFTRDMRRLAYIAWGSGALASILGLWLSLAGDLPTGPLIVCMYGVVLVGAIALRRAAGAASRQRWCARHRARRVPHHGCLRPGPSARLRAVPLPHRPACPAPADHAPARKLERPHPRARGARATAAPALAAAPATPSTSPALLATLRPARVART